MNTDLIYKGGADISENSLYRYSLWRSWGAGPRCLWMMHNPSTADATTDDRSIRRCVGFAKAWGFDGIEVVNLFAYRATDPKGLLVVSDPVGPENYTYLKTRARADFDYCVCAFGVVHPQLRKHVARALRILKDKKLMCFGATKGGWPRHPLYMRHDTELQRFHYVEAKKK